MNASTVPAANSVILFLLFSQIVSAQYHWVPSVSGTSNHLYSIDKCNNLFLAVGEKGTILASSDCLSWSGKSSGTLAALNSACWGNGLYVAVGDSGTIVSSSDAAAWTKQSSGTDKHLTKIVWGNNSFLAFSGIDSGTILLSKNGIDWTQRTIDNAKSVHFVSAVYSKDKYVVGGNGSDPHVLPSTCIKILSSSDGTSWTVKTLEMGSYARLTTLVWGNNEFIASSYNPMPTIPVCGISSSADGVSWSFKYPGLVDSCYPIKCVSMTWGSAGYIAIGSDLIGSRDGAAWTWRNIQHDLPERSYALGWNGQKYLAAGKNGAILTSDPTVAVIPKNPHHIQNKNIPDIHSTGNHIRYTILSATSIGISILNLHGQRLRTIADGRREPGRYRVALIPPVKPGSYIISIKTALRQDYKRVIVP